MSSRYQAVLITSLLAFVGCGDNVDPAPIDAIQNTPDSAPAPDGPPVDGAPVDAPPADAAVEDAAVVDAGMEDAAVVDANPVDATPVDAAVSDAAIPDASTPICNAPLDPQPDGSTVADPEPAIVISEINPGNYIEVYNRSNAAVDLSMAPFDDDRWCAQPEYPNVTPAITIPALSYAELDWDADLSNQANDSAGELALYANGGFGSSANVLDFVCWGPTPVGPGGTRIDEAIGAGKWTGDCLPAIPTDGAINRLPSNTGISAADYTVLAPPNPQTCTP